MLIFEELGIVKVFFEEDNNLLVHEWIEYNPDSTDQIILNVLQKLYELFLAYPVEKVLVITDRTKGAFSPTIQEYIRDVQFPRLLANTNIRFVATVKPSDLIAQICTEVWEEELKSGAKIVLHNVASEKEAREWLSMIGSYK